MAILYPVEEKYNNVTSFFGFRTAPTANSSSDHKGIDISMPVGTEVKSAINGIVKRVAYNNIEGNVIEIADNSGITTLYKHLDKSIVRVGDSVTAGQKIALSGNTGETTGAHLHFETRVNGVAVDPLSLLNSSNATLNTSDDKITDKLKDNWLWIIAGLVVLALISPKK